MMKCTTEQYRGYTIEVSPFEDRDNLWDFEYSIFKDGNAVTKERARTLGGQATADVACLAGLQVARIEVDNLLALEQARAS